ncbi:unnamed protein product, partial [Rotaria sp. Silwood1]
MVVLVTNLLIGLAVGDVEPLLTSAKDSRLDKLYELAADFEIFKYQSLWILNRICGCCFMLPRNSNQKDLKKECKWWKKTKKRWLETCAREVDKEENSDDDEKKDNQTRVLEEIRIGIQQLNQVKGQSNKASTSNGP